MNKNNSFVSAVILAAGISSRMMSDITKQRMLICGMTVLQRCVLAFERANLINEIIVVASDNEKDLIKDDLLSVKIKKPYKVVTGGESRQDSARFGFYAVSDKSDYVAIHDGARCLITPALIDSVVASAQKYGAATLALKVTDTIKLADNGFIKATQSRENLYFAQTPQVFATSIYKRALEGVASKVTDDNMLVEALGEKVYVVDSSRDNIKITTPDDISYAEYLINKRNIENV